MKILLVEDDPIQRAPLVANLERQNHDVVVASDAEEAWTHLLKPWNDPSTTPFNAIICDWRLRKDGMDGPGLIRKVRDESGRGRTRPYIYTILISKIRTDIKDYQFGIDAGADAFLFKPIKDHELWASLHVAERLNRTMGQLARLRHQIASGRDYEIVGESPKLLKVVNRTENAAQHPILILIQGETGTGKELIAALIHEKSPWAAGPFIPVNCGGIPESLIQSELFGYVKGAFNGADRDRPGKFDLARGGTLFLDEVDKLSPEAQGSLLRALGKPGDYTPVGPDAISRKVECRIIAATNQDLATKPGFKEDLYFRLHQYVVMVPPLRERRDDIPRLVTKFLKDCGLKYNKTITHVDSDATEFLIKHDWPGNVRQLQNVIEGSVIDAAGSNLTIADIQLILKQVSTSRSRFVASVLGGSEQEVAMSLADALVEWLKAGNTIKYDKMEDLFRFLVYKKQQDIMDSQEAAARQLGIPSGTLRSRLDAVRRDHKSETESLERILDSNIATNSGE
jgi:DNA-binding NtrC family response regulator